MLIARHAPRNDHAIPEVLHDTGGYLAALTETGCAGGQLWAGYGDGPIKHLLELLLDLRFVAHRSTLSLRPGGTLSLGIAGRAPDSSRGAFTLVPDSSRLFRRPG